jgi:hypothetical protein
MSKLKRYSRSPLIEKDEKLQLMKFTSPASHTDKEIYTLMDLLTSTHPPIESITIGHGRDSASREAAHTLAQLWETKGGSEGSGGFVLDIVDWPEEAASWLRPATRLTEGSPDAWVITGALLGCVQVCRRLYKDTNWDAQKTFGLSSLANTHILTYVGQTIEGETIIEGMRGALSNGGIWYIENGQLVTSPK